MKSLILSIFVSFLALLFSACGIYKQFQNKNLQTSINLPKIENVKTISEVDSIAFEWGAYFDADISGFLIYRGEEKDGAMTLIARVNDKFQTHYVDSKLQPDKTYFYRFNTFSDLGYISPDSEFIEARTSKRLAPLPFVQSVSTLPNKIKLIWRPHPDLRVSSYVIERANANGEFKEIAEVKNRLSAEYIDDKLKPNQKFTYRVFAKTHDGTLSESSQLIQALSKALPPSVTNLKASSNLASKIQLTWDNTDFEEFSYFKVYASSSILLPYTLLAKVPNNSFEDINLEAGKSKSYKVSLVDKDGLESVLQNKGVEGKTLDLPQAPVITAITIEDDGVQLSWEDSDYRAVEYTLYRYGGSSNVIFKELKGNSFKDSDAIPTQSYSYELVAIDEFGLESKPSNTVKVGK